jgi:hypothetical protein
MSRWISWVRPEGLPLIHLAHRPFGGGARQHRILGGHPAAAGVAQERGHVSSTVAAHSTRVCPNSMSTEPSAVASQFGVMVRGEAARRRAGHFSTWVANSLLSSPRDRVVQDESQHQEDQHHHQQARNRAGRLRPERGFFTLTGLIFAIKLDCSAAVSADAQGSEPRLETRALGTARIDAHARHGAPCSGATRSCVHSAHGPPVDDEGARVRAGRAVRSPAARAESPGWTSPNTRRGSPRPRAAPDLRARTRPRPSAIHPR